ncbi:hypothetical protein A0H81_08324 [Grifola frondosa]|uniref:Helicase Sen1 N-terminal domain-containing protein n=1 Tax=Grifola frondosa TaxID=5627 RepID=A0A1C7M5H2_GRIFR|nr:hypothetical protein A0H81_08324 [Grifola frondosa]
MLPSSSKLNEVQNKLAELRDSPMAIVPDEVLRLICNYLIGPFKKSQIASQCPQPFEHWFCAKADQLTVDAAVFLIRLHAYQNSFVDLWKFQLTKVLSGCCDCVRGLKEAEVMSRHTYFATFNDEILRPFYRNFHDDRLKAILDALAISHITPDPMPNSGQTLLDAPSAVVFHIFSDLHMMRDTRIIKIIHSYLPKDPITSWPKDYPPVGLLLLLVDQAEELRYWAQKQASFYKVAPVPMEHFLPMHVTVLEVVTNAVTGGLQASGGDLKVLEGQIAKDPAALWSGYCVILRFVPLELFRPSKSFNFDIRHVILGHLHDTGNRQPFSLFAHTITLTPD